MANFDKVEEVINEARGIAWDTCHKIYVLMDDEQMALMGTYGYDPLISADEMSADEMLETLKKWYDESCGLRFINAVRSHPSDPNLGFIDLISQFEEEDCEDCGESGCAGVCNDYEDEDEDEDEDTES
jgi:hypothetical protein